VKKITFTMIIVSITFANNLSIKITNIKNKNGKIAIGLYNKNDKSFTTMSKAYKNAYIDIYNNEVLYHFYNIKNNSYAIAIFHDENANSTLDKNFFGIPIEGYGFSNNVLPKFRSATFVEASFKLNSDKNITIKMEY
jgi:uncharacterized protein (DUF2141 family)